MTTPLPPSALLALEAAAKALRAAWEALWRAYDAVRAGATWPRAVALFEAVERLRPVVAEVLEAVGLVQREARGG